MGSSARVSCALCHDRISTRKTLNLKLFCTKFFIYLLGRANSDTPDSLCKAGAVLNRGENLCLCFCVICRKLVMKFQLLQQRIEKLRNLNWQKSAALATKVTRRLLRDEKAEAQQVIAVTAAAGSDTIMVDELAGLAAETEEKTSDQADGISAQEALLVALTQESAEEGSQSNSSLTAESTPNDAAAAKTDCDSGDSNDYDDCEYFEDRGHSWRCKLCKRSFKSFMAIKLHIKALRKRRAKGVPNPECDAKSTAVRQKQLKSAWRRQRRGPPSRRENGWWRDVIEEVSVDKFLCFGKHAFNRTNFGYQCGSCDFKTTFSKVMEGYSSIVMHIRNWHLATDGRPCASNSKLIQASPNHFLYGKYELEKINDEYVCRTCGHGIKDARSIRDHVWKHRRLESTEWICEICGKFFRLSQSLYSHKSLKHKQLPSAVAGPSATCNQCGKSFKFSVNLKQHQKQVHGEKRFICVHCGRKFFNKNKLYSHENSHTGEKSFVCQTCGKKFAASTSLYIHGLQHTGRKFTCEICDMEFTQPYSVTRHKNTAHPGWKKTKRKTQKSR